MQDRGQNSVARRTPQACAACRRRKTKCDGARPRCRYCAANGVPCVWPDVGVEQSMPSPQEAHEGAAVTPVTFASTETPAASPQTLFTIPSRKALKRCFELFFTRHFAVDFCSFDYRPDLEARYHEKPFLVLSIISLCSRYLTPHEAMESFGQSSGLEVHKIHTRIARSMARDASDEPTVANIQAYLVLAMSELLASSGSRHWMYAGTAIRMAQIMRLNKEYHQKHSLKEQEIRRRTFWACFLLDRSLASLLFKPHTLSAANIGIALPGTDASIAYQEGSRGLHLENLQSFGGYPSEVGLGPYLIKTVRVWADMADFNVCRRRALEEFPPTDPRGRFFQQNAEVRSWISSLPPSLQWSAENYQNHRGLGQGRGFLAMHMLLQSAQCVAHQGYLPHLDGFSVLSEKMDRAGWSYFHREASLIETCVSSALAIGDMLTLLAEFEQGAQDSEEHQDALQSVWVAISVLGAVNTFLWILYSNDENFSVRSNQELSERSIGTIRRLVASWRDRWKVAKQWVAALDAMKAMYRAAYSQQLGEVPAPSHEASSESDEEAPRDFRPQPGDGYPSLIDLPDLQATLRVVSCDSSAKPIDIQTAWMQLSSGWPYDPTTFMDLFPG